MKTCDQELNLKFVGLVEKHEELYNYKLPGYSRRDITEKSWQEIASQMNMSAPECKEKWRNLRTVFMRKMKRTDGKKKAYYLETAMQFCLPFVKTTAPLNLNIYPSRLCSINDVEVVENAETSCDSEQLYSFIRDDNNLERKIKQEDDEEEYFKVQKRKISDNDDIPDYSKTKKPKIENKEIIFNRIDRQQSIQMFLLSLVPELEELDDSQIKIFKRRVFNVIDEIST